ncbi:MAG: Gfo/Idh/MocA family oxidoreductase [Cyclobacteriaceae bacterium]|nr:Gfo/Idh/MocA family oxidoreductase [Cyclobacteriaceae bacterium]
MIKGTVKWGIIGCGDVTEIKSGPAFQKVDNSELIAVMRRNGEKAADFAKRHHVSKWYDDADKMIADPEVNSIYVATPPSSHAEYAIKSMKAGKPVYVEKPMAMNADECRQMIDVSKATGTPLFVAYYRRALPYFVKLKELMDMNAIGEVKMINLTLHWPTKPEELGGTPGWRVDPSISGGGHFHDLAAHQLDYLEFVFGPIKTVKGIATNQAGLYPTDDVVSAAFQFESGVAGTGSWCFTVPEKQTMDVTEIVGSKGKISFSFFSNTVLHVETETMVENFDIPHPEHVHQPLVDLVVKDLRGEGTCPSTGETGVRATEIMDQITGK